MTEQQKLKKLLDAGYKVEVTNPESTAFSEKYYVYQETPFGKLLVIVDNNGNIVGQQG